MDSQINYSIPQQNFEIIRDQIALVLATELANQYNLDNTYPKVSKVYVERFTSVNSETEVPLLNVNLLSATFEDQGALAQQSTLLFGIDVYTQSAFTDSEDGDVLASKNCRQLGGLIRYILKQDCYKQLALPRGIVISKGQVTGFKILDKTEVQDALCDVLGRVMYQIQAVESNEPAGGNIANEATMKVTFNTDDKGFYIDCLSS